MSEHLPAAARLTDAVDRLADRFRAMPQSRLLNAVPGHPSRAAAGLALARRLADRARALEGLPALEVPDSGAFAVGDQLAVTGHDLALAAGDGHPQELAAALADVEHTDRLTA
ncbi:MULTISPECIES: hypothetical protein [Kitasatospora]|jgi:hypothetical protein|uniref:hypothetical protein n=1 Tax=Kitasatospora TaxID=2063 RepID=UPI002284DE8C|nr:hypothetical protein [Kitasatospora sp. YST-16]MDR3033844.1 hypothetical protein [Kitasatospora sp.]WAL73601.1 hypothetical protein OU787_20050 [Kitasatospora sp. YST-16]WNW39658.1 hypothetical protein RKE32_19990 [Streptomyces sp. Li-HN-5-13]